MTQQCLSDIYYHLNGLAAINPASFLQLNGSYHETKEQRGKIHSCAMRPASYQRTKKCKKKKVMLEIDSYSYTYMHVYSPQIYENTSWTLLYLWKYAEESTVRAFCPTAGQVVSFPDPVSEQLSFRHLQAWSSCTNWKADWWAEMHEALEREQHRLGMQGTGTGAG